MGIFFNLSISIHLEIDRESEIANHEINRCLFILISYQQDDWYNELQMAEFAVNNNKSVFRKSLPFIALINLYLDMSLDIVNFWDSTTIERIHN